MLMIILITTIYTNHLPSTSQKGRIIYTFHIIEGEGRKYDQRNWLQPPREGFTKLFA